MTRGNYNTKQKSNILNIISNMRSQFTVKDVYALVSNNTSLTTIYRFIDRLVNDGVIEKIIGSDGDTYYQYMEKCDCNHFYLRCDVCGKLEHVECSFVEELEKHIKNDHKFYLNREHIIMNGICRDCYKKEGN